MDFEMRHEVRDGEARISIDMDLDTAWEFAKRIVEAIGASEDDLAAVYGEIYGKEFA